MTNIPSHRLDSSFLRVERAEKHLNELRTLLTEVARIERYSIVPHKDFHPIHNPSAFVQRGPIILPLIGGILIGESCYNLRAALDYLVFALTEFDCGQKPHFTDFPVVDSRDKFRSWEKKITAKGMHATHAACFERLQPYKGCDWTRHLAEFRNYDTHNEFVRIDCRARVDIAPFSPDISSSPSIYIINIKDPVTANVVQVQITVTIMILFNNGLPIVETLEEINAGVAQTLADFKPEFER